MEDKLYSIAGGDIIVWLEKSGSVMLKCKENCKDPVELGEGEVADLIEVLTQLYSELQA